MKGARNLLSSPFPATLHTLLNWRLAMAISKDLLEILVCPLCKATVELKPDQSGLKCVQCHRVYPIRDDIPVMLVDEAKIEEEAVESVLECLPRGSRIAILRLRSLGDCVLPTPALDILKRFRPDFRLAIFVENRFREIFEGNRDLAEIHPPELAALRRFRPQLCLNFHGGTRSARMTELSGARYRAGFGHYRQQFVYNVHIPRAQEILHVDRKVHTAEHLASAVFFLGAPIGEIPRAKVFPGAPGPPEPAYAVIHAVAATPEK